MEKSASIANIAKALMIFHNKVGKIKKDSSNPFFKSKYASLSTILESIEEPLQEAGLSFAQFPVNDGLTTILMHGESGEFMASTYSVTAIPECSKEKDKQGNVIWRSESYITPQALGSAVTYARRYAISAILGLNIDDDDDGNAASGKTSQPKEQAPAPQPKQIDYTEIDKNVGDKLKSTTDAKAFNEVIDGLKKKNLYERYYNSGWIANAAANIGLIQSPVGWIMAPDPTPEQIKKAISDFADCKTLEDIKRVTVGHMAENPLISKDKEYKEAGKNRVKELKSPPVHEQQAA